MRMLGVRRKLKWGWGCQCVGAYLIRVEMEMERQNRRIHLLLPFLASILGKANSKLYFSWKIIIMIDLAS